MTRLAVGVRIRGSKLGPEAINVGNAGILRFKASIPPNPVRYSGRVIESSS